MISTFLFLLGELLGAVRTKSGTILIAVVLLIFSFLALFSSFFLLGTPVEEENGPVLAPQEIMAYLSPRLSPGEVEELYSKIREWKDVQRINYLFTQELQEDQAGGIFLIRTTSPSAVAPLLETLGSIEGIVRVVSASKSQSTLSLSTPVRIGLLIGLAVSAVASMLAARYGFRELLRSFAEEIQLMHLSGTAERMIQTPIIALGILCGLVASLLLIVAAYLFHFFAVSHPEAVLRTASGLVEPGRVLTVSLLSLLLGLVMGGLIGVLGASLTGSREFQTYS